MPVSYHFQGCKALLRIVKRCYIKYHAFAFTILLVQYSLKMFFLRLFIVGVRACLRVRITDVYFCY